MGKSQEEFFKNTFVLIYFAGFWHRIKSRVILQVNDGAIGPDADVAVV